MGKKKGKKQNKKQTSAAEDAADEKFLLGLTPDADAEDLAADVATAATPSADSPAAGTSKSKSKKNKKSKKQKAMVSSDDEDDGLGAGAGASGFSAFGALEDDEQSDDMDGGVGGGGGFGGFAGLDASEDDASDSASASASEEEPEPEPVPQSKSKGKGKGKSKQPQAEEDDLDDLLAELDGPSPASKQGGKGSKKKGKKKGKKAAQPQDDLDDIMAELDQGTAKPTGDAEDTVDESKLSKAQLKRLRKKQAAAAAEASGVDPKAASAVQQEAETTSSKKKKKKGKGKPNVSALKAALIRQKEEEARLIAEAEQRQKEAEEAERKAEEERARVEEERKRRQQEKLEQKEKLRKEGKLLSKAQRKKKAEAERRLQQMREAGLVTDIPKRKGGGRDRKASRRKGGKGKGQQKDSQREAELLLAKEAAQRRQEREQRELQILRLRGDVDELEAALAKMATESSDVELSEESEEDEEDMVPVTTAVEDAGESWEDEVADSWEAEADEEEEEEDGGWEALADADEKQALSPSSDASTRRAQIEKERTAKQGAKEAKIARKRAERRRRIDERVATTKAELKAKNTELQALEAKQKLVEDEQAEAARKAEEEKAAAERSAAMDSMGIPLADQQQYEEDAKGKRKDLRSPICCILGHVDTGKTKLLDKIRSTNVQDREAGGITQQIGATYFPMGTIQTQTEELNQGLTRKIDYSCMPGLLIIDTPGHESFTNLRSRGSNLCDIAILVVDIMHGLEPQTLESIDLLRRRKTPFVVALNKIDRMLDWHPLPWGDIRKSLKQQPSHSQDEFERRVQQTIVLFAEQGLNCALYYENTDLSNVVSLVPTSAHTGEGIPDLLMLLVRLTQHKMSKRLTYLSELQCTVLEVKVVEGLGTTIDVVLVNGVLYENDTIVVCGLTGPIVTSVRALLTPQPLKELRVKSEYVHHKQVKAAMGVKIAAAGLESAVAGTQLMRVDKGDDVEELKDVVMQDLASILSKIDKSGKGVCVQASTLGSLEALLQFLGDQKIPVSGINIGPVHKKDVMKAAVMLEHKPELAIILAFDVRVVPDAVDMAEQMGVKIFTADIIYHLFDMASKYMEDQARIRREQAAPEAVFPVLLDILPDCIFNNKDPMVFGCRVTEGLLKLGTPLCLPSKDNMMVGRVVGIEKNHAAVNIAEEGEEVAVKIDHSRQPQLAYGRQFDYRNQLVSKLSRRSIDLLKANFKTDLQDKDWRLVIKLKKMFAIM